MRIEETMVTIEVPKVKYFAEDGTEFQTELACRQYEKQLERKEKMESIRELLIYLDNFIPRDGEVNPESWAYNWYRVRTDKEFELLSSLYPNIEVPEKYPEYICIETCTENDFDPNYTTMSNVIDSVTIFFNAFGMNICFENREEELGTYHGCQDLMNKAIDAGIMQINNGVIVCDKEDGTPGKEILSMQQVICKLIPSIDSRRKLVEELVKRGVL